MLRAHKITLDPTNKQVTSLVRAAGCARFAYNWALERWNKQYEARVADPSLPAPSQVVLRRELNAVKHVEFPWMLESTKCAPQEAIIALGVAFKNFFAGRAKRPTFKKKGVATDSFRLSSGQFRITRKKIRVPNIGWIRMREALRWADVKQVSVTISRRADRWFASIHCELPDSTPTSTSSSDIPVVGVDVGVREFVVSDGTRHRVPRGLRAVQRRLKRAQQSLSRKVKGSKNRAKARMKVSKLHAAVSDARSDWLHKLTTELSSLHGTIVIEDLHVAGMVKNHRLAMSIIDASFGEFCRQLAYKTTDRDTTLVVADRWFPSSKTCSACSAKTKQTLALHVRLWTCDTCNVEHDRDLNAARNLAAYAFP